jgi:hypothetical protein
MVFISFKTSIYITYITSSFINSYMDTEQFEKAVTDYEKAFKLDKTKGNSFSFSVK